MKIISAIVGLVLLLASLVLAYLSSNVEQMDKNKEAIVLKYVNNSTTALEDENYKAAIKFAKLAIIADPKNKAGFKAYEAIMEAKYHSNQNEAPTTPTADEGEDEEDMGC